MKRADRQMIAELLADAREAYWSDRDIPKAQRLFKECLKYDMNKADAFLGLAQIADQQGKPSEALKYYDGLLGPHPAWTSSLQTELPVIGRYAELCDMQRRPADALVNYQKILRYGAEHNLTGNADPNVSTDLSTNDPTKIRARAHLILGITHMSGDRIVYHDGESANRALHAYREAIRLEPDLALAHYYLAVGLKKLHRDAEAKVEFTRAEKVGGHSFQVAMHKRENDAKALQANLEKTHRIVHVGYTGPNTPPRVTSEPDNGQTHVKRLKP